MKKTIFIKNALILTLTSLLLRFAGIIFKIWMASLIGSEGIGLYQLIFSVYVLASTFATSGISTAVTRLCSEELAVGCQKGAKKILNRAFLITFIIAFLSVIIVFFGADFIAVRLLGDLRATPALKILPFALPFMGISSCIRGYFISKRKVMPNALSQIFEQAVRIVLVVALVKKFITKGLAFCCTAVILGDVTAEILSCFVLWLFYKSELKETNPTGKRLRPPYKITSEILRIATPIISGRYLNSLLRTAENILVPKNLAKFHLSNSHALSQFGMIKGMALPVLFFPSAVLNSVSTLLIPEISEATAKKQKAVVKYTIENILKLTSLISFIFAAIFFVAGEEIGTLIYNDKDVGFLLRALSPIVPLMYLDSISDGILKGLDQQAFSFNTAISDSLLRIILITVLLKNTGIIGFIGIMYFSNLLTCLLNVSRLLKISGAALKFIKEIFLPLFLSVTVSLFSKALISLFQITNNLVYIMLLVLLSVAIYFILLLCSGILEKEEILHYFRR